MILVDTPYLSCVHITLPLNGLSTLLVAGGLPQMAFQLLQLLVEIWDKNKSQSR